MHTLITGDKLLDRELNRPDADYHVGIIAGACGVGTSWVLLRLALHNALNGVPTLFISTDTSRESVLIRTHAVVPQFKQLPRATFTIAQLASFDEARATITKWLQGVDVYAARNGIAVCLDGVDLLNMPEPAAPGHQYRAMVELNKLALEFDLMLWTTVHTARCSGRNPQVCDVQCLPHTNAADIVLHLTELPDNANCLDQPWLRKLTIVKDRYSCTTQGKYVHVKVGTE